MNVLWISVLFAQIVALQSAGISQCSEKREMVGVDQCVTLLHSLATAQSLFLMCTVFNYPNCVCEACADKYKAVLDTYKAIVSPEKNCTQNYFDRDRLNLVYTTQKTLIHVWGTAYCEDCFHGDFLEKFMSYQINFSNCIRNADEGSKCVRCLNEYDTLNDLYTSYDQQKKGKVCYDAMTTMNQTRFLWSKELNCCKREPNLDMFNIAVGLLAILPLLFYGASYCLYRNSNLSSAEEGTEPEHAPTTRQLLTAAILTAPIVEDIPPLPAVPSLAKPVNLLDDSDIESDN